MNLADAAVAVIRGVHVLVPDTRSVAGICPAAVRNTKVEAVTEDGTIGCIMSTREEHLSYSLPIGSQTVGNMMKVHHSEHCWIRNRFL
jgi:hypothetical protein